MKENKSNNNRRLQGYWEHKEEEARKTGTGFLGFISTLDWLKSIEMEEGRPLDETKITFAQKVYAFTQGAAFGSSMHSIVLFLLSLALYSLIYSMHLKNYFAVMFIHFLVMLFSLMLKLVIPLWMVQDYYLFNRGITYTYLRWFISGYSLGLFIPEFFYTLFVVIFILIYNAIVPDFMEIEKVKIVSEFLNHYFPQFTSLYFIPVHIIFLFMSYLPSWVLRYMEKKYPVSRYQWMPLDYIPDDEK